MHTILRFLIPPAILISSFATLQSSGDDTAPEAITVGTSPWGPNDAIGALNRMTEESRAAVLTRVAGGKVYDLGVEYFVGMPSWHVLGDPRYQ